MTKREPVSLPAGSQTARIRAWRERLVRLNESTFLDLVRNYLGEVKTPFNKQDLLIRLESFLTMPEIQDRIVAFLNLNDQQLLSGIQLCQGSSEAELFRLLGTGRAFVDFHLQILNLEDRLLIFREDDMGAIYLNPHLVESLEPHLSESLVVEASPISEIAANAEPGIGLWLDEAFLAAIYSFIIERPEIYNAQGALRKRPLEEFRTRFASLAAHGHAAPHTEGAMDLKEVLEYALRGLTRLGLVVARGAMLRINHERWVEYSALPRTSALLLLWTACLEDPDGLATTGSAGVAVSPYFAPTRIAAFARHLATWLSGLDPDLAYADSAISLLWDIQGGGGMEGSNRERCIAGLKLLGLFTPRGNRWQLHPALSLLDSIARSPEGSGSTHTAPLTVTPSFEASLTGWLPLKELLVLASCASLRSFGSIATWELNRESCQRGFAMNISPELLVDTMARHSGRPVSQNIAFSCGDWYRDFASVRLWDGIVLYCEGNRRTVLEHLDDLKPWILAQPAPGVFVLDRTGRSEWLPLLAGVGVPASTLGIALASPDAGLDTGSNTSAEVFMPPFASMDLSGLRVVWSSQIGTKQADRTGMSPKNTTIARELREHFMNILAQKQFAPDIQEELEKHVRNNLILREEQLGNNTVRVDKSEARGLDYNAKIRVMEQAIKNRRDFLELTQNNSSGESYTLLVWPQKLRQNGTDLILSAQTVPEGKELAIMTGKVSLVRRVRATLFS